MASEFSLIDAFTRAFGPARSPRGPGDDCAVLPPGRGDLCVTTDAVVEDVHFTRRHFSLEDIGHKAMAVNLSDLAAMGAKPRWFLCALELPRSMGVADVQALARGMASLARTAKVALAGGNVSSAGALAVTLTVAGEVPRGKAMLRSGAKPGDVLYVSGTLGAAARGLELLMRGARAGRLDARAKEAIRRQKRPLPQLALGLIARRYASAGMDLTDGLAQDLSHLCAASRVGADLDVDALPLAKALDGLPHERAVLCALSGGEDYELLFAIPRRRASAFERTCAVAGHRVTAVGRLTRGRGVRLSSKEGRPLEAPAGFDHFKT